MTFIADLHIHSKFSRATAKNLDLEHIYIAAQIKGITVVGTGDFTHPGWFAEIREKLVPAEQGLFKLNDPIASACDREVPASCRRPVRFMLSAEISNIYKKDDKTRKNHNLVFVPDLSVAERLNQKLDRIGNIKSDGRPILGLDARNLLEIVLETSKEAFLIPAHIWTPWFSLLGSKSGFDSVEACFEDLSSHIFAVETGLSSDPAMNRRVSGLDDLTLVSNSDAHSPSKLGREANIFNTPLSYPDIKAALMNGGSDGFLGTFEFYPEEGKYHADGHRKCRVRLMPPETKAYNNICPECGKPITLGVLNRVEELADRPEGALPETAEPYHSLIPLDEIISELFQVGAKSKRVQQAYQKLIESLGPELHILNERDLESIGRMNIPLLDEAILRMRENRVVFHPGYDGEFGRVLLFDEKEREKRSGRQLVFDPALEKKPSNPASESRVPKRPPQTMPAGARTEAHQPASGHQTVLNQAQQQAVDHAGGPLLIAAGPGTGKTLTITHKMARLIRDRAVSPHHILALTFTNKAARSMKARLADLIGSEHLLPFTGTFHAFCLDLLKTRPRQDPVHFRAVMDDEDRRRVIAQVLDEAANKKIAGLIKPKTLSRLIAASKQRLLHPQDDLRPVLIDQDEKTFALLYQRYQDALTAQSVWDFEDLIFSAVTALTEEEDFLADCRHRFRHIFIDEYQDLNYGQYELIKMLASDRADLCVIGDPNQSIYGFRGSDVSYFTQFTGDYPRADVICLTRNYRSNETILKSSYQVIKQNPIKVVESQNIRTYSHIKGDKTIQITALDSERAEAVFVGKTIEEMIGGTGFHSMDFDRVDSDDRLKPMSFSDFAVLYRTGRQGTVLADILEKAGIPCRITGKTHFLKQPSIERILSFLKIISGRGLWPDVETALASLNHKISRRTTATLKTWSDRHDFTVNQALSQVGRIPIPSMALKNQQALYEAVSFILEATKKLSGLPVEQQIRSLADQTGASPAGDRNRTDRPFIDFLLEEAAAFSGSTQDFLDALALKTDTDMYDQKAEKVALMTMHASKGLEFPVVFITGCEDRYLPFTGFEDDRADPEEERRLFYVAMTRAKETLHLTYAKKRKIHGLSERGELSPFVMDIEAALKHHARFAYKKKKTPKAVQLQLFDV